MTYDALGRTLTEDDEESGTTATYEYIGHELEVTDGKNHTTRYVHNALGQIKQVIDALAGETDYTYHPFGELHTVTDNDVNETEILYDARGFKTDMYDPDMGHWEYDHNAYGELVEQIDAKSQIVELDYDVAGRLISRDEDEGLTEWDYYPYNASAGHAGKLYQVTSPGGLIETYEYHATNGQVNEILREIGSADYELDFAFDTHGRMTQLTYPVNVDSQRLGVEYLYDSSSVLSQARNATTTSLVYYTLNEQDGSGATRRATLGNGLVEKYTYEATTGRLSTLKTGPTESATIQNLEFDWDLAGNLEERVDQLQSRTEVFNYDALDRLTSVVRNSSTIFSVGYTTDKLGNIASKTGITGTYTYGSSRPHAVTAIGSTTFAYDANGNMTDRGSDIDVDWTSYNLPSRIERTSGEYSEFLYGADRSRYQQIEGAGSLQSTRHYASPGLFEVLTWSSGASRVDYHYIHANGRAVAQFTTANVEADELQYLLRDHQGSVVATTSTSGTVLDRFEYDAFGVRTTTVGDDDRSHRGYTGHEHLAALDLIHMNGRVQDPAIGRFLSPDPLVQAPYHSQSLNRYSYVWNNPLSLVDPSGFQTEECAGDNYCGDVCLFFFSCEGLDFQDQLWLAETHDVTQRPPAFIFDPPGHLADSAALTWSENFSTRVDLPSIPWADYNDLLGQFNAISLGLGTPISSLIHGGPVVDTGSSNYQSGLVRMGAVYTVLTAGAGSVSSGTVVTGAARGVASAQSRALVPYLPTANGFLGATSRTTLQAGTVIDRYGGTAVSRFFSPAGTPLGARALPPETAAQSLRSFEVVKALEVEAGTVAPAFGQLGLGTQYRTSLSLSELVEQGFIREVVR